ncbi:hypothetical protein RJ639_040610 [Escallonia herrerae]|uniref:U-box domain-containing protein n=1 Tax=Escallonia herrerae TaxID=1293975 RepID=A0AA89B7Q4_9ASTE|nr:hypothetical protein RJ639_040610 [Escallonia herrerae]
MGGNGKHRWKIFIYRSKSPKKKDLPREFLCPMSGCLMFDPVVVTSGQTFERGVAEKPKMLFSHASTELNHRAKESVIVNVPATPLLSFATRPACYSSASSSEILLKEAKNTNSTAKGQEIMAKKKKKKKEKRRKEREREREIEKGEKNQFEKIKLLKPWTKLIRVYGVLTNQARSFSFESRGWVTTDRLWSRIAWTMQEDVKHASFMRTSSINLQNHCILQLPLGSSMSGD